MRQQQLGDAFGRVLGGEMTDAAQDFLRFTERRTYPLMANQSKMPISD
jgi:hypothetical protein